MHLISSNEFFVNACKMKLCLFGPHAAGISFLVDCRPQNVAEMTSTAMSLLLVRPRDVVKLEVRLQQ